MPALYENLSREAISVANVFKNLEFSKTDRQEQERLDADCEFLALKLRVYMQVEAAPGPESDALIAYLKQQLRLFRHGAGAIPAQIIVKELETLAMILLGERETVFSGKSETHPDISAEEVPAALKNARKLAGETQAQVAEKFGVAVSTLSRIERGETSPNIQNMAKIRNYIDNHTSAINHKRPVNAQ